MSQLKCKLKKQTVAIIAAVSFIVAVALAYGVIAVMIAEATNSEYSIEQNDGL